MTQVSVHLWSLKAVSDGFVVTHMAVDNKSNCNILCRKIFQVVVEIIADNFLRILLFFCHTVVSEGHITFDYWAIWHLMFFFYLMLHITTQYVWSLEVSTQILFWQAKWFASVRWLLAKAGGGMFPAEYGEPIVTNDKVCGSWFVMHTSQILVMLYCLISMFCDPCLFLCHLQLNCKTNWKPVAVNWVLLYVFVVVLAYLSYVISYQYRSCVEDSICHCLLACDAIDYCIALFVVVFQPLLK